MGKKKDERKRREREAEMAAAGETSSSSHKHGGAKHGGDRHEDSKHGGAAPFAGIAATIARQMGTPVGRQMIAAGLMAAASAIAKHDAKTGARPSPSPAPPAPPAPPVQPVQPGAATPPEAPVPPKPEAAARSSSRSTGPFAGETPEPPRSDAPGLPPEMAKVLDSVSLGLERLFAGFGKPTGAASPKKDPPAS